MARFLVVLGAIVMSACSLDGAACDEGAFDCEGQILLQCENGAEVEVSDCDVEGGMCMASMGHCHMDSEDGTAMPM